MMWRVQVLFRGPSIKPGDRRMGKGRFNLSSEAYNPFRLWFHWISRVVQVEWTQGWVERRRTR